MMTKYNVVSRIIPNIVRNHPLRWTSVVSSGTTDEVKPFEDIPGPKGLYNIPFIGSFFHFKPFGKFTPQKTHKLFESLHEKYGPVVRVQLGREWVMLEDVKDMENVFRNEGRYPIREVSDITKLIYQRHGFKLTLSHLQGEEWHALRTPVNKRLMKADSAYHYLEPQNAVADEFVQMLATQKLAPEKMKDLFLRYAAESIGVVTFNTRLGFLEHSPDQETSEFLEATKQYFAITGAIISGTTFSYRWYRSRIYRDMEKAIFAIRK
ncbi:cytochrome P450 10-like [Physella acuta]|uniref:cytochrome P450 10-like n=1 Tax=Physella acuta TaxID=109671 RepID=UPI0027DD8EFA|nr:cytochrome P450 10-like [Physella acuta]